MSHKFEVRVSKDYLVFPAGHFITYGGGECETLHGHNYRAGVTVEGDVDENYYVIDFTELKKIMKGIVKEMDHKMLLPDRNPRIELTEDADSISATYKKRTYTFPRSDVVVLPIPNTTAEMIAQYIAGKMKKALASYKGTRLRALAIEVEESFGQSAWYREEL
jgi:6-pyruvoyltetrahydropterin/6-carboxytetrahydropterin synthase